MKQNSLKLEYKNDNTIILASNACEYAVCKIMPILPRHEFVNKDLFSFKCYKDKLMQLRDTDDIEEIITMRCTIGSENFHFV